MRQLVLLTLIVASTLVAYAPALAAGFIYEDHNWLASLGGHTISPTVLSWQWQARMSGTDYPSAFHLFNVAWHLLNGALVYAFVRRLVGQSEAALIGACVFLWHPLQTESVAYVNGRSEILSLTGVLVAAVGTAMAVTTRGVWRQIGCGALVLVGLAWAFAAKSSGIAGAVLVGWMWLVFRSRRVTTMLLAPLPLLGVLVAFRGGILRMLAVPYVFAADDPDWLHLGRQAAAWWRYLALVVWPAGQSVDHDFALVPPVVAITALVGVAGWLVTAWSLRHARRVWAVAMGWMAIGVLPRFVVRLPEYLNEHQMHLSMVGVALMAAVLWSGEPAPMEGDAI